MRTDKQLTEIDHDLRTRDLAIKLVALALACAAVGIGLGLIFGGPERVSAPSFAFARTVPGSQDSWGAVWVLAGVLVAYGTIRPRPSRVAVVGHFMTSTVSLFFATSLLIAAMVNYNASLTGIPTYYVIAVIHAIYAATLFSARHTGNLFTN